MIQNYVEALLTSVIGSKTLLTGFGWLIGHQFSDAEKSQLGPECHETVGLLRHPQNVQSSRHLGSSFGRRWWGQIPLPLLNGLSHPCFESA